MHLRVRFDRPHNLRIRKVHKSLGKKFYALGYGGFNWFITCYRASDGPGGSFLMQEFIWSTRNFRRKVSILVYVVYLNFRSSSDPQDCRRIFFNVVYLNNKKIFYTEKQIIRYYKQSEIKYNNMCVLRVGSWYYTIRRGYVHHLVRCIHHQSTTYLI